mmetsp:Transcript_21982/g.19537  ORF Transcript_21982/g.19537 Transcript_21982/m.19537 type:complete len:129 (-) Transcript_21982:61-447(-)
MIHKSMKSIAKIMENSSNSKNKKDIKKAGDLKNRPPRQKFFKIKSKNTKKNKTVSLDGNEEEKGNLPNLDLNIEFKDNIVNALNTFLDVPSNKLNLTQPNIDLKKIVKRSTITKKNKISKERTRMIRS